jgi:hypothetical protein
MRQELKKKKRNSLSSAAQEEIRYAGTQVYGFRCLEGLGGVPKGVGLIEWNHSLAIEEVY